MFGYVVQAVTRPLALLAPRYVPAGRPEPGPPSLAELTHEDRRQPNLFADPARPGRGRRARACPAGSPSSPAAARWRGARARPARAAACASSPARATTRPRLAAAAADAPASTRLPDLWQLHETYILAPIAGGLLIVDQHAAHERILYEEARARIEGRTTASQGLLFALLGRPDARPVRPRARDHAGADAAGLRDERRCRRPRCSCAACPAGIGAREPAALLRDILDGLGEHHGRSMVKDEPWDRVAKSFACHAAVRAGERLSREEMNHLVDRLFATGLPHGDPHGRPTYVRRRPARAEPALRPERLMPAPRLPFVLTGATGTGKTAVGDRARGAPRRHRVLRRRAADLPRPRHRHRQAHGRGARARARTSASTCWTRASPRRRGCTRARWASRSAPTSPPGACRCWWAAAASTCARCTPGSPTCRRSPPRCAPACARRLARAGARGAARRAGAARSRARRAPRPARRPAHRPRRSRSRSATGRPLSAWHESTAGEPPHVVLGGARRARARRRSASSPRAPAASSPPGWSTRCGRCSPRASRPTRRRSTRSATARPSRCMRARSALEDAIALLTRHTVQYAKRQATWLRGEARRVELVVPRGRQPTNRPARSPPTSPRATRRPRRAPRKPRRRPASRVSN